MRKIKYIVFIVLGLCVHQLQAQVVLTLDSVMGIIEQNNPMLKMYDQMITAENTYAEGAKSWMPPTLSAGLWQTPYSDIGGGMFMITAEQMIPNPSKLDANQKYMQGMAAVDKEAKQAQRNQLFSDAKQAYFEWAVLKKKYIVLNKIDSLLNYLLQTAQLRYKYNKERLDNIYKAQADLYELRNMEAMLVADMKMKNVMLNTLMKRNKDFIFDVDTALPEHNYETVPSDSAAIALARSDVKQLNASRNLLRLQQSYENSKRLPDFGISASHMQSLGMMPNQFSVMGMITIPIVSWSSKMYKSTVKGLNDQMNAVEYQKQNMVNMASGEIVMLQVEIKTAKQQISNYQINIVPAYYKSYQAALLAYEQNTGDLFVVLDAFKMYRMENMEELDELNQLLKLQVEYEREMEIR